MNVLNNVCSGHATQAIILFSSINIHFHFYLVAQCKIQSLRDFSIPSISMEQHEHSAKFTQDQDTRESGWEHLILGQPLSTQAPHSLMYSALMQTSLGPRLEKKMGEKRKYGRKHNLISQILPNHTWSSSDVDPFYPSNIRAGKAHGAFLLVLILQMKTFGTQRGDVTHARSQNNLMLGHRLEDRYFHDTMLPLRNTIQFNQPHIGAY